MPAVIDPLAYSIPLPPNQRLERTVKVHEARCAREDYCARTARVRMRRAAAQAHR